MSDYLTDGPSNFEGPILVRHVYGDCVDFSVQNDKDFEMTIAEAEAFMERLRLAIERAKGSVAQSPAG